ncbi:GNAT family N-acetyltransferase [Streptomyces sp. NPDC056987]|uniref:GNAT family N-acetyltransferase n=1 Tax=Streptomyces sp. NPDC056987 TaxID=3345988 RepID=UPI003643E67E
MSPTLPLHIELLPSGASSDTTLMGRIADLVNRVYAIAEDGQWLPGATRTSMEEITELTRACQIVVARTGGTLVGSIRVQLLAPEKGETGMLVADPDYRNMGIGRELRRFAVEMLRQRGAKTLQIELLVPRDWSQESKQFMAEWNERAEYRVIRKGAFEEQYPDLAPLLATPCDFIIYEKAI